MAVFCYRIIKPKTTIWGWMCRAKKHLVLNFISSVYCKKVLSFCSPRFNDAGLGSLTFVDSLGITLI